MKHVSYLDPDPLYIAGGPDPQHCQCVPLTPPRGFS